MYELCWGTEEHLNRRIEKMGLMLASREGTLEGLGDGGLHPSQKEKKEKQRPRQVVLSETGPLEGGKKNN